MKSEKLERNNIWTAFLHSTGNGNNFSSLQFFIRLTFRNGLASNKTRQALKEHYGTKENGDFFSFKVIEILMRYELELIKNKMDKSKSSKYMLWFENEMAVFGFDAQTMRDVFFIQGLREAIVYNTIDF